MAKIDLSKYGITGTTEIVYNPSYEVLFEEETKPELEGFEKGQVSELGAVNVMTGIYTGRSPKDKYIVMDENSKDTVWWTTDEYKNDNHPATQEAWNAVKEIAKKELSNKRLFVVDAFCGANKDTRMAIRFIVEVNLSVCINCYVLKKSVTFDCIVDVRLRFFVKVDNFSVASAFEVEYAVVIPAMLVITDQETFRVCGKSSFTCSGKTEEDSCVFAVHICVCRAVHGSHAFQWKEVVHHREHTFLHFSAVPCVYDNLLFSCDVEHYSCFRVKA